MPCTAMNVRCSRYGKAVRSCVGVLATVLTSAAGGETLIDPATYRDLGSFRPTPTVQIQILKRAWAPGLEPWHTQKIERAKGQLNLDRYPLLINKAPKIGGKELSAAELLSYVRLHLSDFLDDQIATFHAVGFDDQSRWESGNPLGAVMQFDIKPVAGGAVAEKGCVVTSEVAADHWIFSTVYASEKLVEHHPVSGNRWFGVIDSGGPLAGYFFVTRAADRPTSAIDQGMQDQIFAGAHTLWMGLLVRLQDFVEKNGGTVLSNAQEVQSQRFPWDVVKSSVYAPTTGWLDIDGKWETTDSGKRFRIEAQELTGKFSLVERNAAGTELSVESKPTFVFLDDSVTWTFERPNDDPKVLTHLGFAPDIQQEILNRNPRPSFIVVKRVGDKLTGKWSGITVIKDTHGKLKELKQPGDTPSKDFEFVLRP